MESQPSRRHRCQHIRSPILFLHCTPNPTVLWGTDQRTWIFYASGPAALCQPFISTGPPIFTKKQSQALPKQNWWGKYGLNFFIKCISFHYVFPIVTKKNCSMFHKVTTPARMLGQTQLHQWSAILGIPHKANMRWRSSLTQLQGPEGLLQQQKVKLMTGETNDSHCKLPDSPNSLILLSLLWTTKHKIFQIPHIGPVDPNLPARRPF